METTDLIDFITPGVYVIIDVLKVFIPEGSHRYIPVMAGVVGLAMTLLALYFMAPYDPATWFQTAYRGLMLGFAAVGLNQLPRQLAAK